MNAIDVRNNLMTFITAGHETTALALTWTFYLLSLHPAVEERVRGEIAAVTGGGPVRSNHVDDLIYTNAQIRSSKEKIDAPLPSRGPDRPCGSERHCS